MKLNQTENEKTLKNKYFRLGLMIFAVLSGVVLLYFFLYKFDDVKVVFSNLFEAAQPIILGFVVAYLINPLMKFIDKFLNPFFVKVCKLFRSVTICDRYHHI